jgi:hypothetical protein
LVTPSLDELPNPFALMGKLRRVRIGRSAPLSEKRLGSAALGTWRRCLSSALWRARPRRTHPEGEKPRVGLARRPGIRVSRRSLPHLHTGRACYEGGHEDHEHDQARVAQGQSERIAATLACAASKITSRALPTRKSRHPELAGAWLAPSPGVFALRFKI